MASYYENRTKKLHKIDVNKKDTFFIVQISSEIQVVTEYGVHIMCLGRRAKSSKMGSEKRGFEQRA